MKIVPITDEMLNRARDHYSFTVLENSITKGAGNFIGALGEIVVLNELKGSKLVGSFEYDIEYKGLKIEVKTKKTKVIPQNNYLCSVTLANHSQDCNVYLFCRIHVNLDRAYILGFIEKDQFFKKAKFNKKNDLDINGWRFKSDSFNIEVDQLLDIDKIENYVGIK